MPPSLSSDVQKPIVQSVKQEPSGHQTIGNGSCHMIPRREGGKTGPGRKLAASEIIIENSGDVSRKRI